MQQVWNSIVIIAFLFGQALSATGIRAQTSWTPISSVPADSLGLNLAYDAAFYFKNNEYFGPFTKGFTGIGTMQQAALEYRPGRDMTIRAGAHAGLSFGSERDVDILPIFSLSLQWSERHRLIFGTLEGGLRHGWIEPFYRTDFFYSDPLEYGIQLKKTSGAVQYDAWLDWQNFIESGDDEQERFIFGLTGRWALWTSGTVKVSFPFQFKLDHVGGQIDTNPNSIRTLVNVGAGTEVSFKSAPSQAIHRIRALYLHYEGIDVPEEMDDANYLPLDRGNGIYAQYVWEKNDFRGSIGYFGASDFFAPEGEFLFGSLSETSGQIVDRDRQIITADLFKTFNRGRALRLELGGQLYYDVKNNHMDVNMALYAFFGQRFRVSRPRSF